MEIYVAVAIKEDRRERRARKLLSFVASFDYENTRSQTTNL